jgi:general secretion pathway protein J
MKNNNGFTLIELLVALGVFAVLAIVTSQALVNSLETRERLLHQENRLSAIQLALILIKRDMTQASVRPVRTDKMHILPPFSGDQHAVEWTRDGLTNPKGIEKRSTLKRVALLCQQNQLIRRRWHALDTTTRKDFDDTVLLDHLTQCHFNYLNHQLESLPVWRSEAIGLNQGKEPLPKALQLILTLSDYGQGNFLFIIPEALYD